MDSRCVFEFVFSEGDVSHPVQCVLDTPVPADQARKVLCCDVCASHRCNHEHSFSSVFRFLLIAVIAGDACDLFDVWKREAVSCGQHRDAADSASALRYFHSR